MLSILQALSATFGPRNFSKTEKRCALWGFIVPGKDSRWVCLFKSPFKIEVPSTHNLKHKRQFLFKGEIVFLPHALCSSSVGGTFSLSSYSYAKSTRQRSFCSLFDNEEHCTLQLFTGIWHDHFIVPPCKHCLLCLFCPFIRIHLSLYLACVCFCLWACLFPTLSWLQWVVNTWKTYIIN